MAILPESSFNRALQAQENADFTEESPAKARLGRSAETIEDQRDDTFGEMKTGRYAMSDDTDVSEVQDDTSDEEGSYQSTEESEEELISEDDISEDGEGWHGSPSVEEEDPDIGCDGDPDSEELDRICSGKPKRRQDYVTGDNAEISAGSCSDEKESEDSEAESAASEHNAPCPLCGTSDSEQDDASDSKTRAPANAGHQTYLDLLAPSSNIAIKKSCPHASGHSQPEDGSIGKAGTQSRSTPNSQIVPGAELKASSGRTRALLKIWKEGSSGRTDVHVSNGADGDKTLVEATPEAVPSSYIFKERLPSIGEHPAAFKRPAGWEHLPARLTPFNKQDLRETSVDSLLVEARPQEPSSCDRVALDLPAQDDAVLPADESPTSAQPECSDARSGGAEAHAGSKRKPADEVERDVSGGDETLTTIESEGAAAIDPAAIRPSKRPRLSAKTAELAMAVCGGAVVGGAV